MKKKQKKTWREQPAGLGARRQRPDSDPAFTAAGPMTARKRPSQPTSSSSELGAISI